MSHYISQSKHQFNKKIPKKAPARTFFGLHRLLRQRALFVLTGLMICVTTLAFSPVLADISNVVRFSCMAFVLMLGCLFSVFCKQVPVTLGTVAFALFVLVFAVFDLCICRRIKRKRQLKCYNSWIWNTNSGRWKKWYGIITREKPPIIMFTMLFLRKSHIRSICWSSPVNPPQSCTPQFSLFCC